VARQIAEAVPRGRLVVTGTVVATKTVLAGGVASYCGVLDDGTGQVDLLFLGQREVRGLKVGSRCTVEGTARSERHRLVVWNPLYRLEALDLDGG
jgi:hypothetical protein